MLVINVVLQIIRCAKFYDLYLNYITTSNEIYRANHYTNESNELPKDQDLIWSRKNHKKRLKFQALGRSWDLPNRVISGFRIQSI